MNITTIPWNEISIGMGAIILVALMVKIFANIVGDIIKQLDENRKDYKSYVEENNHTMTQLVKESTTAIVTHTEILKGISDRLNK